MNAVEIEEAISLLAQQDFNPAEFPFAFLEAFGNKKATGNKPASVSGWRAHLQTFRPDGVAGESAGCWYCFLLDSLPVHSYIVPLRRCVGVVNV